MPLAITILAIIGAITLLALFCLTALFVACHLLYLWQRPSEQMTLTMWKSRAERSKAQTRK